MNLTRRSLFASAVALLALPRKAAAERLLGPTGGYLSGMDFGYDHGSAVSVLSFGAKGDGVTDDTDSIRRAISHVKQTGGVVYLPPGVYHWRGQ